MSFMDAVTPKTNLVSPSRKLKSKITSPCIGVCKYAEGGLCRGCTMTKPEKKTFKKLKGRKAKQAFLTVLAGRLVGEERYPKWARAYRNRCKKKGTVCALDWLEPKLGLADSSKRYRTNTPSDR